MTDLAVEASSVPEPSAWDRFRDKPWLPELTLIGLCFASVLFIRPLVPMPIYLSGLINTGQVLLLAIGLILAYRTNRFLHLGLVGMAMLAGRVYAGLNSGQGAVRFVDALCGCLEPTSGWLKVNWVFAVFVGLALAAGVPWLFYQTIVRRFAAAPPIMATVASLFAGQVAASVDSPTLDPFLFTREMGEQGMSVSERSPAPFEFGFNWGNTEYGAVDILTVVVALAALIATATYLRRSAAGRAIRAGASDAGRAATLGVNVFAVVGRVWVIGGLAAGVATMLTSWRSGLPITGGGQIPLGLLVPALLVAVVGRLRSLTIAALAALAFGIQERALLFTTGTPRLRDALLVFLVAAVLLLRREQPMRSEREGTGGPISRELRPIPPELRDLPTVRRWRRILIGSLVAIAVFLPWVLSSSQTTMATSRLAIAVVGLSVLVVSGWSGQLSLGQFAFAGIGGWLYAVTGWPLPVALVAGALVGGLTAAVVSAPALRLRGLNLAILTLAFAVSAGTLLKPQQYLGVHLPELVERPVFLGMELDDSRVRFYTVLVLVALVTVAVAGLRATRTGRALLASRDNEASSTSFGISPTRIRIAAFAVAGALAGIGGVLYVLNAGAADDVVRAESSVSVFTAAVIGGLGAVYGPFLGAAFLFVIAVGGFLPIIGTFGEPVGALFLLVLSTGGLSEMFSDMRDAMLRRLAARERIVVPALLEESRWIYGKAPMLEKTKRGRESAFVPTRYEPGSQWALVGHGQDEDGQS